MIHNSMSVLGGDVSLNHAAFVTLNADGSVRRYNYCVAASRHGEPAIVRMGGEVGVMREKGERTEAYSLRRLVWWHAILQHSFEGLAPDFVGFEDYAFAAKGRAHATGELGGLVRVHALRTGAGIELVNPRHVKKFATGSGSAEKDEMVASLAQWGVTFPDEPPSAVEDLADAYVVARITWTKALIRDGALRLDELEQHQREVMGQLADKDFYYLQKETA